MSWDDPLTRPRNELALDLYLAFNNLRSDHFNAQLFRLIHKSDFINRGILRSVYPLAVELYNEWYDAKNPDTFFDRYQVYEELNRRTNPHQS